MSEFGELVELAKAGKLTPEQEKRLFDIMIERDPWLQRLMEIMEIRR